MNDFFEKPSAFRGPFPTAYTRLSTSTRNVPLAGLPAPIQDEIPISQLPLAGLIQGDEMVALVQNGITARTDITAIVLASGTIPGLINKTVTLVYKAAVRQQTFSLSLPDHFGNVYPLSISNALHVTVNGARFIEDDGSGAFGQYTVNIGSNSIILITPLLGGEDVVFDIFNINAQDVSLSSSINTQPLIVITANVLSPLAFVANGNMTILYVNGRAFSDDSIPPSFIVNGRQVSWVDPLFSIVPGDAVIASYTYDGPSSTSGGGGGGGGGISDAPADSTLYARENNAWQHIAHTDIQDWATATQVFAPLNSPVFIGTPSMPAGAIGVTPPPGDVSTKLATTAFVSTMSAPPASNTLPLMDGAAAIGLGLAWARSDHVHPSDTTRALAVPGGYLALSGGTMVGPLVVIAPTLPTHAASKQYVDSLRLGENRIINGNFAINQRGQASPIALAAGAYGHDHWKAGASGSATYSFSPALPDTTLSITVGTLTQVIEGGVIEGGVYTLSWAGTAQARIYQGSPTGSYGISPRTSALLPAGVNTIVEFTVGTVTDVKFEIGSAATPYNRQSLAQSQVDCTRYCQKIGGAQAFDLAIQGYVVAGQPFTSTIGFQPMRAPPTVTPIGGFAETNVSAVQFNAGLQSLSVQLTPSATGNISWTNTVGTSYLLLEAEL